MIEIAAASGTTDIVATPHANGEFRFDPDRVQQLFQDLSRRKAASIRIHLGCDFHLTYANLLNAIENPSKYTINHHQYLMVELPDLIALTAVKSAINQLIGVGIVPIITHPKGIALLSRSCANWSAGPPRAGAFKSQPNRFSDVSAPPPNVPPAR
jgi:protein-tyrosine phosphatase